VYGSNDDARVGCPGRSPKTVNLREDVVVERVNGWLGRCSTRITWMRRLRCCWVRRRALPGDVAKGRLVDAEALLCRSERDHCWC
jgi:hypothetical protein